MRTWIVNRVKALASLPGGMAQRVISSGNANNPLPPFIVVSMGNEQTPLGMPASSRTQEIPVDIWVHDRPGSMVAIDDACVILKDNIPYHDGLVVGGMSILDLKWEDTSADAFDDHYGTNTRRVSFRATTRR